MLKSHIRNTSLRSLSRFVELFGDPSKDTSPWKAVPLGKHLSVVGGYAFKSSCFVESGIPVLRIGNINSGRFTPNNLVYWKEDHSLDRYKVYPGDLVISLTGTVGKDDYGNVCILGDDFKEYYLNQRNAKLSLDGFLDSHFIAELLKFSAIKRKLTGISRGIRQANISNSDILNLAIPLPPITIQRDFSRFVIRTNKSKFYHRKSLNLIRNLIPPQREVTP